jgi:putative transposase
MARRGRIVVLGLPHHATQRGNRKTRIFFDDEDRTHYLALLREYSRKYEVLIWTYSLMPNHTHNIVVPPSEDALSKMFRDVHGTYGSDFNRKYGLTGHLWEARFYSCAMDEPHFWAAVRYVERNPVRAGMVGRAEDYEWSSARAHVTGAPDPVLDPGLPLIGIVGNWSEWLAAENLDDQVKAIRQATATGRPCGSEEFLVEIEKQIGKTVRPKKRGRKKPVIDPPIAQLF